jgi:hypothetical protein
VVYSVTVPLYSDLPSPVAASIVSSRTRIRPVFVSTVGHRSGGSQKCTLVHE